METEIKTDAADLSKKYFFIVSNALIDNCRDLKINSVQLHLLLTVIRHAYQNDSAYPSIPTLQRKIESIADMTVRVAKKGKQ